ncbi:IS21 family transposase [Bacillaceae bacterium IKA-2]|nr:IS21 family transposase [Bacillaceae bacterium IKA-2]WNF36009.1 IS21 family transposase [Bacillaceae bacterium IKA-2]WNF37196.1 IS21 family transposase [Bacillaceae bacterium IKA-2]WNF38199.1 IS21 family transposase [Bacillaceae bacterium IKA-2]WNF38449.1 IS21 family transposase [Bacillaceae bacterium IKA-2]
MDKWQMYMEIQQLLKQGFSKSKVAGKLGVSRTTVYRYLKSTPSDMSEWVVQLESRRKKLDPFKELILSWLYSHPDMTAAQVYDWLQEKKQVKDVSESTVRAYVRELRLSYDISKETTMRDYEAVAELPMGEQIQVDFGQTVQKTIVGKTVRLYFIAFVLSHSRYKYKEWVDRPFTTKDVIRTHENAFQYFAGIPRELVYDQDALLVVSENGGDLILTKEFQAYKEDRKLTIWVCRKADPETKGKIENMVGFVKVNFSKHRIFQNIDKWNEDGLAWLKRTGNYKIHNTTKKRPCEVFLLEKQHLRPVSTATGSLPAGSQTKLQSIITRTVRKDNTIWYKSNRYSVPLGTFEKYPEVAISEVDDAYLMIVEVDTGEIFAKHKLSVAKGELIQDRQHTRDRTKGVTAYIQSVAEKFENTDMALSFLETIKSAFPRYIRDQLQLISKEIKCHEQSIINEALKECVNRKLFCATDFIDMVQYLDRQRQMIVTPPTDNDETTKILHENNQSLVNTKPATRDINDYLSVLAGDV